MNEKKVVQTGKTNKSINNKKVSIEDLRKLTKSICKMGITTVMRDILCHIASWQLHTLNEYLGKLSVIS